jgi:translation initiation factor IF-1
VTLEMSPYDLTKGRINFRHKDEARPSTGAPSGAQRRR